jgi:hypothetical protein
MKVAVCQECRIIYEKHAQLRKLVRYIVLKYSLIPYLGY